MPDISPSMSQFQFEDIDSWLPMPGNPYRTGIRRVWLGTAGNNTGWIGNFSELEEVCANRRFLWDIFRMARLRHGCELYSPKWNEFVQEAFRDESNNLGILRDVADQNIDQSRDSHGSYLRKDIMSNMITAIACTSHELASENKKYLDNFCKLELDWFVYRLMQLKTMKEIRNVFRENNISEPNQVSNEYLATKYSKFYICKVFDIKEEDFDSIIFYEVPLSRVPRLLARKQVIARRGFTIVPATLIFDYLIGEFKRHTQGQISFLNEQAYHLPLNVADMASTIRSILKMWLISTDPTLGYKTEKSLDKLTLENINQQALKYFPLCSQRLHLQLQRDNHLHYHSRYQYLVFLRNAGFAKHSAQQMFSIAAHMSGRLETSKMKQFIDYYIPWIYGLKGRLRPHMPFTCSSILDRGRNVNNCNGCPFMSDPLDQIKSQLKSEHVPDDDLDSIVSLIQDQQHPQACRLYFKAKTGHDFPNKDIVHNPNDFYNACVAVKNGDLQDIEDLCKGFNETSFGIE